MSKLVTFPIAMVRQLAETEDLAFPFHTLLRIRLSGEIQPGQSKVGAQGYTGCEAIVAGLLNVDDTPSDAPRTVLGG